MKKMYSVIIKFFDERSGKLGSFETDCRTEDRQEAFWFVDRIITEIVESLNRENLFRHMLEDKPEVRYFRNDNGRNGRFFIMKQTQEETHPIIIIDVERHNYISTEDMVRHAAMLNENSY